MKKMMLFWLGILVLAFAFLGSLPPEPTDPLPPSQAADVGAAVNANSTPPLPANTYPVLKVIDGDTISIMKDGKAVTLRLIGLDTPEPGDPRTRREEGCVGRRYVRGRHEKARGIMNSASTASKGAEHFALYTCMYVSCEKNCAMGIDIWCCDTAFYFLLCTSSFRGGVPRRRAARDW